MKTFVFALFMTLSSISFLSHAQSIDDKTIVRGLMQSWLDAYNSKDIDALMALYSDQIYYANNGNELALDVEEIRQDYNKQFKSSPNIQIDFSEELINVNGTLGYVAGKYRIRTSDSPEGVAFGRVLIIFEKQNGNWKLAVDFDNQGADISDESF